MMVRVDGTFKQWLFGVAILLFVAIVRGAHGQNACPRTSYVSRSRSVSHGYTTSCGLFGWSRCGRTSYSTAYDQHRVTTYDICCAGWSKDSSGRCLTAHCSNPCQHGRCYSPNVCTCNSGYTGTTCNQAVCDILCQHGGVCTLPNTCSCQYGYTGETCNQAICNPSCQHGVCSSPDVCTCNQVYRRKTCNQAICDSPCQHGVCSSPDVCMCNHGYEGQLCNQGIWCSETIDEPNKKMASQFAAGRPLSGACLRNHVIYTFLSRNLVACAFTCKRNSACKSFNYFTNEGRCELNSVGGEGSSKRDWVENMDCVYYQS